MKDSEIFARYLEMLLMYSFCDLLLIMLVMIWHYIMLCNDMIRELIDFYRLCVSIQGV